jgi:hypothetical protein
MPRRSLRVWTVSAGVTESIATRDTVRARALRVGVRFSCDGVATVNRLVLGCLTGALSCIREPDCLPAEPGWLAVSSVIVATFP